MPQRFVLVPLDVYQSLTASTKTLSLNSLSEQREQILSSGQSKRNPYATQQFIDANRKRINMARRGENSKPPVIQPQTRDAENQTSAYTSNEANDQLNTSGSLAFDNTIDYDEWSHPQNRRASHPENHMMVNPSELSILDAPLQENQIDEPSSTKPLTPTQDKSVDVNVVPSSDDEEQNTNVVSTHNILPTIIDDFFTTKASKKGAKKVYEAFLDGAESTSNPNVYKVGHTKLTTTELRDIIYYAVSSTKGTQAPSKWDQAWSTIIRNSNGNSHFASHLRKEIQYGSGLKINTSAHSNKPNKKFRFMRLPY